ncbi:MAG: Ig domain-containing protein [Candidatus Weimeria sp.]
MLNFKKGLALVLAAATAFTFAPVSNFGLTAPVDAEAATADGFTTGAVLATIPAYDGASYDLIENAAISYNGVNYNKNDLTWYLTNDTVSAGSKSGISNIQMNSAYGSIVTGKGSLKVNIAKAADFVTAFNDLGTVSAVAVYPINGTPTVVSVTTVTASNVLDGFASGSATKVVAATSDVNVTVSGRQSTFSGSKSDYEFNDVLDSVEVTNPDNYNKYVDDPTQVKIATNVATYQTKENFSLAASTAKGDKRNVFKGSVLTQTDKQLANGTYYETAYIPYIIEGGKTVTVLKVNITASVSTGPKARVKDDNGVIVASSYDNDNIATDSTIYLDLKTNKTFDIAKHISSDIAGTTYTYSSNSSNVTVDANGVVTAKSVGPAEITISPKAGSVAGANLTLKVLVNANPFATFTVTGKDNDTADVLDAKVWDNNQVKIASASATHAGEKALAAAQVKYIQIEDNGDESSDIKEAIKTSTTATGAALSFVFAATNSNTEDGMVIDSKTGEITVPYGQTELAKVQGKAYAVKVVSSGASGFEATTGYFYFVVDFSDATYSGLEDAYTVGTDKGPNQETAINFTSEVKSNATDVYYEAMKNSDDALVGSSLYNDESSGSYNTNIGYTAVSTSSTVSKVYIDDAKAAGKNMYILVDFRTQATVAGTTLYGHTYKLVKVTSAEGKINSITKIVNTDTNDVLFDSSKDTTRAPQLTISKVTHLTVTLAYPVDSNKTKFLIYYTDNDGTVINQLVYVTAVKDDQVSVTLYPNSKGTEVIYFTPSGNISATDRTITANKDASVAVTYDGGVVKPSKVTGLKVTNKKGAKVSVSFSKVKSYPTMLYYVQKKIGSKTSGKTVGSTKTSLSVAKGKTVKVRVKAYYYDENGTKHVGSYSAWKTLKTDKK